MRDVTRDVKATDGNSKRDNYYSSFAWISSLYLTTTTSHIHNHTTLLVAVL